jgi:hypothetical protein
MAWDFLAFLMPGEKLPPVRPAEADARAARIRVEEGLSRAASRLDGLYALLDAGDSRDAALLAELVAEDLDAVAAGLEWSEARRLTLARAELGPLPAPPALAAFAGLAEKRLRVLTGVFARRKTRGWALPGDRFQARALWRARTALVVLVAVLAATILLSETMAKRTRQFAAAVTLERQRNEAADALSELAALAHRAKVKTGQTLVAITGSNCSRCGCDGRDLRTVESGDVCLRQWDQALARVGQAAGASPGTLRRLARDPWGSPYLLNENEGESADFPFESDTIASPGQNGLAGDADDITLAVPNAADGR